MPLPVSIEYRFTSSSWASACATIILKLAAWFETNLPFSIASFIVLLATLGVLLLPAVGTSLWNKNLRDVLDQGRA